MSLAIRFDHVSKSFGPVEVLHKVSFELAPGRVYGLVGENGAGKSTLMKILAGYEPLTSGTLTLDGEVARFVGSRQAEAAGIVMIHQEFNLAEDLTIAQNIFLGRELHKGWLLDDAAMNKETARVLLQVGLAASSRHTHRRSHRCRATACRDCQGTGAQCPGPGDGRTDGHADAWGN